MPYGKSRLQMVFCISRPTARFSTRRRSSPHHASAGSGCFEGYRVIHTAEGEDACANSVRFNDLLLVPAGFPKTAERLASSGYDVRPVENSEAAKLDGGMSCLSLRFSPSCG